MKHLRSCDPVNVLCLPVCFDQCCISGAMCQHTQFYLRIISIYKHISRFRHKYFTDQPTKFYPRRDILQVWLCTADTSGRCDCLVEFSMDPVIIFMNKYGKPICISRFQLGKLTIFQDFCHDWIIRCQLIQYVCCRRISCFRLLSIWKGQMFKKDHAQLLW